MRFVLERRLPASSAHHFGGNPQRGAEQEAPFAADCDVGHAARGDHEHALRRIVRVGAGHAEPSQEPPNEIVMSLDHARHSRVQLSRHQ